MSEKISEAQRNLFFLMRRHSRAGCDYDYIKKLKDKHADAAVWLENFTRGYYDGLREGQSPEHHKEANKRRYAQTTDALHRTSDGACPDGVDTVNPELLLLTVEEAATVPQGPEQQCSKCRLLRPLDDFYPDKRARSGRRSSCRCCR